LGGHIDNNNGGEEEALPYKKWCGGMFTEKSTAVRKRKKGPGREGESQRGFPRRVLSSF